MHNSFREGNTMLSCKSCERKFSYPFVTLFIIAIFTLFLPVKICLASELLIGTGPEESFSYFAGKTICSSLRRYDKSVDCRLVSTNETTDRLTNLQNNSIDLALVSSKTIYNAFNNEGHFRYITINYKDLRLLMPFYRSPVSLVALRNAKISTLDDLVGKRVNSGVQNSIENQVFKEIMAIKEWQKRDFSLYQNLSHKHSQDSIALKRGSIQAMLHIGMHPDRGLQQLLNQSRSTLIALDDVSIDKLINDKTGFCSCTIPSGTYPGMAKEFKTLAMETLLIGSADTDDETVQLVLTAMSESKKQLQYAHPALFAGKIEISTLNNSYLHPHPAALLFFQATRNKY